MATSQVSSSRAGGKGKSAGASAGASAVEAQPARGDSEATHPATAAAVEPHISSAPDGGSSSSAAAADDDVGRIVRPKSAFLHFMAAHRAKLKAAFPELAFAANSSNKDSHDLTATKTTHAMPHTTAIDLNQCGPVATPALVSSPAATFSEVARLMGWEWRRLTPEQRQPYDLLSAQDKARYKEQTEARQRREAQDDTGD